MGRTKNTIEDMYNIFAEQLERLNDTDIVGDQLENEIRRAEAMSKIAQPLLHVAELQYKTWATGLEYGLKKEMEAPRLLEAGS